MITRARTPAVPAPRLPLSAFDPWHVGMDETGQPVHLELADHAGILIGGEPGAGKSSAVNGLTAHGALSLDCRLILVDGKWVELGPWRSCADEFVGPSLADATAVLEHLQQDVINPRYERLLDTGRRKIVKGDGEPAYLVVFDEFAFFSATVGTKTEREKFTATCRDCVARGRACAVCIVLATQRPSHQIVDPALRDLFGYRWAFRCTTAASSDTILGQGWATNGYSAATIDPRSRGTGWLLAESGIPRRVKAAWLDDDDVRRLAARAALLRGRS
jgi:DNA segregation ATPase FtsK/SpoIIIE, S-DNA-T family